MGSVAHGDTSTRLVYNGTPVLEYVHPRFGEFIPTTLPRKIR